MRITLNGRPHDLEGSDTIIKFLESLGINPRQVAVAINGEVVPRDAWPQTKISEGDTVEIVRAVGGG
jgi:sulfur carrier protein